jgi:fused signal recognition particle receptor
MDTIQILLVVVGLVVLLGLIWFIISRRNSNTAPPLAKSRPAGGMGVALRRSWGSGLDSETYEKIEETLLAADLGPAAATAVISAVKRANPTSFEEARESISAELRSQFLSVDRDLNLERRPTVIIVVGVNGSGKTTTIAKLCKMFRDEGRSVVLGAADTFRAAAAEQLTTWGDRLGFRVVRGSEGADPASVAHDAVSAAKSGGADIAIIDTAGRLHGKTNLMAELSKIYRVVGGNDGQVSEALLVLDATTGQNGLAQVREFASTIPLTGIVLTKLDGTARGGIVVAIEKDLGLPVKFVGLGEGMGDLQPFDPDPFVESLLESA